jgi:uncharacterized membrane protein
MAQARLRQGFDNPGEVYYKVRQTMYPSSVRQQLKGYLLDPAHAANLVFVLLGGWSAGLFAWELGHRQELAGYVLEKRLPSGESPNPGVLVGSAILAVVLWVGLSAVVTRLSGRRLDLVLNRASAVFLGAALLLILPVLSLEGIETDRKLLTLALIAVIGVIAAKTAAAVGEAPAGRADQPAAGAVFLSRPAGEAPARRRARSGWPVLLVMTLGYVLYMSVLTVARHHSFQTHAFDLGIQVQAMYTAVTKGYPLVTLYGPEPINQFSDHFAPIYYIIAPVYAAFGGATALLALQSVALGLGAVPVYLLAKNKIGNMAFAIALAAAYLLYPALHAVNTFDFHEIAMVTPLLLFSLYFLETGRRRAFLVFLVLATLTKEEVALSAAAIGLYILLVKRERRFGGLVLAGSLAYFVLVNQVIMPALGGGPDLARFAGIAAADQTGFQAILLGILTNPIYAFTQIFLNGQKMLFMVELLLPVLFLPLLAGAAWVMALPAFAVALLASVQSQYSLDYHYPAIMIPFVFVLAVLGLQRLNRRAYNPLVLAVAIVTIGLAMNYSYGWLAGKRAGEFPRPRPHDAVLSRFFAEIPKQAPVSTMSDLAPHLSNRDEIYLFPVVNGAEFILLDSTPTANFWPFISGDARGEARDAAIPYLISGEYGLLHGEDGVLLLQRGYDSAHNQEAVAVLLSATYEAEDLAADLPSLDLADDKASNGVARVGRPEMHTGEAHEGLTFGPYASLLAGKYRVLYRLKYQGDGLPGQVATVDVFSSAAGGVLASREIQAADFAFEDQYQEFVVDLETPQRYDDLEFRVQYKGRGTLWADRIEVIPVRVSIPIADYSAASLSASAGKGDTGSPLALTPATALLPGKYRAVFTLKASDAGTTGPLGKIEVVSPTAGGPLAEWALESSDFTAPNRPQPFALDFRSDRAWPDVVLQVRDNGGDALQVEHVELVHLFESSVDGQ